MRYCKLCVQPDTRPGIKFDKEGVCPACRFREHYTEIDWSKRRRELAKLVKFGKVNNVSGYDCIIGVSGGKDSTRQAMYVREELKMKPLLVCCSYPPEQVTERGVHNLSNLISLGFDTLAISPGPQTWKALMRQGFLKYGNWAKSTEMALYASSVRIAVAYQIPLIFLGENPAIQLGDLQVGSINSNANKMKYCHTLQGGDPSIFLPEDISKEQVLPYIYPSDREMALGRIKIRYLGYYWPDFTKVDNANFSIAQGLEIRTDSPDNLGDIFGFQALDDDFVIVNQFLKYLKFGFGQVTDEVCEEIRFGRMSRETAISLVKKYDGRCASKYIQAFCKYIDISLSTFWRVAESYRNLTIWQQNNQGHWQLKTRLV